MVLSRSDISRVASARLANSLSMLCSCAKHRRAQIRCPRQASRQCVNSWFRGADMHPAFHSTKKQSSVEHTSELQTLMRNSYPFFRLYNHKTTYISNDNKNNLPT